LEFDDWSLFGVWCLEFGYSNPPTYWLAAYSNIAHPNISIGLAVSFGSSVVLSPLHFVG
jgi:hypothetical protein